MATKTSGTIKDGDLCKVVGGVHAGKSGTVRDIHTSKLALIYIVRDMPGVAGFRIEEESLDLSRVKVMTEPGFPADGDARIRAGMKARLGESVEVVVEHVAQIAAEGSGKFRYVVSKVAA